MDFFDNDNKKLFGIASIIFAITCLLTVIFSGRNIYFSWVSQVLFFILNVVGIILILIISATIIIFLVTKFLNLNTSLQTQITGLRSSLLSRIKSIDEKYEKEIKELNRGYSKIVITLTLICDALIIVSDKMFSGDVIPTLLVSLLLLIWFFVAIEFISKPKTNVRILGYILFYLGIFLLPVATLIYHKWNLSEFFQWIITIDPLVLIALSITILLYIILPVLTNRIVDK